MVHVLQQVRIRSLVAFVVGCLVLGNGLSLAQEQGVNQHANGGQGAPYRIGFHLWKPGAIYDEAMQGIKDGLTLAGIAYEAVVMQSDNHEAKAIENLRALDAMGLHLIYSLASAGTQVAMTLGLHTPIITTVVNHPASLGIDQRNGQHGIKLTGTSYYVDAHKQLQFYRTLFPGLTKVGMIYDRQNPAGASAEEPFMRQACQKLGIAFFSVGIDKVTDLAAAAKELVTKGVDAIVIPTNNLVYENLQAILIIAYAHKIPVLSMNKQGVENGALAALFADTYNLGRYTAPMAKQILVDKTDPRHIPFQYISEPDSIVNLDAARQIDYEFPADILGKVTIIIQ
jgi:putative ABC transport system substrate-binding protein